jgi:hypothetical protein
VKAKPRQILQVWQINSSLPAANLSRCLQGALTVRYAMFASKLMILLPLTSFCQNLVKFRIGFGTGGQTGVEAVMTGGQTGTVRAKVRKG